jgi:hypothetical protein
MQSSIKSLISGSLTDQLSNPLSGPLYGLILALALFTAGTATAGEISRALFTTGIDDHEPTAMVYSIDSNSSNSISFFTEVNNMSGKTVTHQWTHQDKVMFEKTFEVKAARWRVWTSKTLIPSWTGIWTVNVLDNERMLLTSKTFEYL